MRSSFITSLALFANLSLASSATATPVVSDPTITPAPNVPFELFRKQNDDRFIGWLSFGGTWTSRTCEVGATYYQSGEYWRCCATSLPGCNVPVGCVAGSLIFSYTLSGTQGRSTFACSSVYTDSTVASYSICNTGFLYENSADSDALTNVFCGVSSLNWSYFRARPSEQTSTEASSSSQAIPASPTASSGTIDTNPRPKKKQSWIAGAVVGPIVGLALLGLLLWFFLVRRKKKTPIQPQPPMQQSPSGIAGSFAPQSYATSSVGPQAPTQTYSPPPNAAPFGVTSHSSWAPQSPTLQSSQSPYGSQGPYGMPPGQQQWQPNQQGQQMYSQPPAASPTHSPPPQGVLYGVDANKPLAANEIPFSAELDARPHQQVGQFVPPQQQQR